MNEHQINTNNITENNRDANIFPPMTDIERMCMLEWGENGNLDLDVITLYNILKKHLNNAEGNSYTDRIKSLNFTVVNGTVFNNPFVQILTMFYIKQINKNDKEKDIDKCERMDKDIDNNIVKFWNQLLDYLNLNE